MFSRLIARGTPANTDTVLTPSMIDLLISLLVLVLLGLALMGVLAVLRRRRCGVDPELPVYNGQCTRSSRRVTITAGPDGKTQSVLVYDEKRNLMDHSSSPPPSPVPEIRITFPEEEDESGKRKSGRVVVVRISDAGSVGLEPYREELPPYQTLESGRFQSLDLERMGGLKEKDDVRRWA